MTAVDSRRLVAGTGVALLAALFAASLFVGVSTVDPAKLLADPDMVQTMLVSRLPRTLAVVLAGSGLAVAGSIMQTLARNRFVEPMTAGTAQGAMIGILLATLWLPGATLTVKALVAVATAGIATALFLALARRLPPVQPLMVALVGLIFGGVLESIALFVAWRTDLLQMLEVWTTGEFSGVLRGRYELLWASAAAVAAAFAVADRLTVLSLGRDASIGLGLNHARTLKIGLVIVSMISALNVAVVGMVPFVGLVIPALVARLAGDNLRSSLWWIAGGGAALVLACDILGRLIRYPYEIPASTILGVVGGVVFLVIIVKGERRG